VFGAAIVGVSLIELLYFGRVIHARRPASLHCDLALHRRVKRAAARVSPDDAAKVPFGRL
jgi:hypothetical protein